MKLGGAAWAVVLAVVVNIFSISPQVIDRVSLKAYAAECQNGQISSDREITFTSYAVRVVATGVQVSFALKFDSPIDPTGSQAINLRTRIYRNGVKIAGNYGAVKDSDAPIAIGGFTMDGRAKTASGNHIDKTVQAGRQYTYQVWADISSNPQNPNCTNSTTVTFSAGGEDTEKGTPPCVTKITPTKVEREQASVGFHQVYLTWSFDWPTQPTNAIMAYKTNYISPELGIVAEETFTAKNGVVRLRAIDGTNTFQILAIDTTTGKFKSDCKPVSFLTTQAAGPYNWTDQEGNSHPINPGQFVNDGLDSDGCSLTWILSGFGQGPSEERFATIASGRGFSAIMSRMAVCVFDALIFPAIQWGASLIEYAAGIAHRNPVPLTIREHV